MLVYILTFDLGAVQLNVCICYLSITDIDGTLLLGKGPGGNTAHKLAIEEGVRLIHGMNVAVNDVPHAGSTDRAIIRDMVLHGGGTSEQASEKMEMVIKVADEAIPRLVAESGGMKNLVLPGVISALDVLQESGAQLALTTGNLESCAWSKLASAGLDSYFKIGGGGFGSDCFDRTDILKKAIERNKPGHSNLFHVGDSVADMKAARECGAKGIGVLTGSFTREQLEKENPFVIFDDLSDTQALLKAIDAETK